MKLRTILLTFVLLLSLALVVACGANAPADDVTTALVVVAGDTETHYTAEQLAALEQATVDAEGSTYVGVPLAALLQDAGIDPAQAATVSAIASDGFSATYEGELVLDEQTIVAYATEGGDLAGDDGAFRMVLPDQPGRMNVRMLARIEAGS